MNPDRLKFEPLPQGRGGEATELWGLRAANPALHGANPRTVGAGAAATGAQAPGHRESSLLPRNRELIQKYFDSK